MCSLFFPLFCDVFVVFRTRGACLCFRGEVCGSGRLSGVAPPPQLSLVGRAPVRGLLGAPLPPAGRSDRGVTRGGGGGGRQFRAGAGAVWT